MAEQFLEPRTVSVLEHILEPQYNGSIGRAAAWADGYAHTDEGRFSYQWHWIDAHDFPPTHCDLYYNRDCAKGGCVVSAIENQTSILRGCIADVKAGSLTNGVNLTCSYALKWVSHFMGDIAQPLHASGRAAGGNFFKVKFGNVSTELHAVSYPPTLRLVSRTDTQPRYGTTTSPTLLQPPPTPSQTKRLRLSSKPSYPASGKTCFGKLRTCGWRAAIH
jgi:hypothetical protein